MPPRALLKWHIQLLSPRPLTVNYCPHPLYFNHHTKNEKCCSLPTVCNSHINPKTTKPPLLLSLKQSPLVQAAIYPPYPQNSCPMASEIPPASILHHPSPGRFLNHSYSSPSTDLRLPEKCSPLARPFQGLYWHPPMLLEQYGFPYYENKLPLS